MRSFRTRKFHERYSALSPEIQEAARKAYRLWMADPRHPSLHFKPLRSEVWSIRVTLNYRAIGVLKGDAIYWNWIGPHEEYERMIAGF